jgi:ABC-type uncharacterized transport system substrate-binding protein
VLANEKAFDYRAGMTLRLSPGPLVGLALLVLGSAPATAHPHVFIDYTVAVLFDDSGIEAMRVSWTFDEMYSAMLAHDYTSRPHDTPNAADIQNLKKKAFDDTADFHYFIDIRLNGATLPVKTVSDFNARFENHRMTYFFTVPISAGAPLALNTLEVDAFDNEFYIDFELAKKLAITIERGEKYAASCAPKKERRNTTIIGAVDSVVVACTYGRAS